MSNGAIKTMVSLYALGGLNEVGKNMYCIEDEESIFMIDCGVRFPGSDMPGIDYLVPEFAHLRNNRNKIKALFITHGHEDHIGGIPFLLLSFFVPVIYAPKLAKALIEARLDDYHLRDRTEVKEYNSDTIVSFKTAKFQFFRVTHSIPDSFGIVCDTPHGRIMTTGDFKIDLTPIGPKMDLHKIAQFGNEGVDILMSDSTNAEIKGTTPSESNVHEAIKETIANATGRIIFSTFSSNISRIKQIVEIAEAYNRKVVIIGKSMLKAITISRNYGYITIKDETLIEQSDIKNYKSSELLIICTGSQGEPMAALSRLAGNELKDLTISPGDTVVFSSSAIPGNGVMIESLVNTLTRLGANVVTNSVLSDIHSSGHPSQNELAMMLTLVKPKYFMPVHGEYRMLLTHCTIAQQVGVSKENCFILNNGDVLTLYEHEAMQQGFVDSGITCIDGRDVRGLSDQVINERINMHDNGLVIVTGVVDLAQKCIIQPIDLVTKGFIAENQTKNISKIKELLNIALGKVLYETDKLSDIKNVLKKLIEKYIFQIVRRKPEVIISLLEIQK